METFFNINAIRNSDILQAEFFLIILMGYIYVLLFVVFLDNFQTLLKAFM